MADEEIRVLITIEDQEFISESQRVREIIDELKYKMQTLAIEGSQSLEDVSKSMKNVAEAGLKDANKELSKQLKLDVDPGAIVEAEDAVRQYSDAIKYIGTAFQEAKKERTDYFKEQEKLVSESTSSQVDAAKNAIASQREWERATKQGLSQMSAGATQYGQNVGKVSQIIQNTSQRTGQSFQQVATRMTQLGTPINLVNNAMKQLNTTVQQTANNIQKIAQNTGQSFQQVANQLRSFGVPLNTINAALTQLSSQTQQTSGGLRGFLSRITNLTSGITGLGTVGKYVFGTVLGLTAINVLRDLGRGIKEAAEAALDFQQKLFAFQISIRALQRAGLDTTLDEWYGTLQKIKEEFPVFSRRDITEAAALAGLMTREFGFTQEQIENVIRSSASLSLIWGKDLSESVRGLTYAISAGYFESLQRVGIQISRSIVAQEALRRGYEGGYNAISEQTRAAITYDIVMSQIGNVTEDTSKLLETQAGQVLALKGNWDDLKVALGDFVVDVFDIEGLREVNQTLIDMANILRILGDAEKRSEFFEKWIQFALLGSQLEIGTPEFEDAQSAWRGFISELGRIEGDFEDVTTTFKQPIEIGGVQFSSDELEDIRDAVEDLYDEIIEIEAEASEKRDDILADHLKRSTDDYEKYLDRMVDLEADYQQRLTDIAIKAQQSKDDADADYAFRLSETAIDAAQRREDAERKYRDRELREERKFQEKLRQLRENFLFDLEDAVRERDAKQIIRLTRQYNLRREQMIREEKISKDDRRLAFEEELREIERQRQERLRQLAVEHARRIQEIDLQAQRERDRAQLEYERRKDAERERYEEQKETNKARFEEQLNDLDTWTQDRINKILEGIQNEYDLSAKQLEAVGLLWDSYYGPDGRIDRAVTYIEQRLARSFQFMNMLKAQLEAYRFANIPTGGYLGPPPDNAGGQAEGGAIVAKRPTVAIFGEKGAEMATFTPLSKISDMSMNGQMFSTRDKQTGRIRLEMLLSPDLEAKIIDNTLGEVADVIYTLEKERR